MYFAGGAEIPESVAPNIRNRSYTIAVEAELDTVEAGGVLFSQGARFGGHALYIKNRRLKYVYNFCGLMEQVVESDVDVPLGRRVFSASFERENDGMPAEGTLTLHVGEEKVGQGTIRTQPGKFSLAGEGLNVGRDGGEPVTDDYPGERPWHLIGGTVVKSIIDVSGDLFVDLAEEARAAFARD
jgi:arylsulfatase